MEAMNNSLEAERIATLRRYKILDTPRDERFDRLTRLAAQGTGSPLALISFVDSDRIWFKSAYGTDALRQTSREPGFCTKAILEEHCLMVADALNDPEASANPLVTGSLAVRSYMGIPLQTKAGYRIGALCVMDREPRRFSESHIALLSGLKDLLMDFLELRHDAECALKGRDGLIRVLAHDLKNPLTIISLQAQILKMDPGLSADIIAALHQIKEAGKKMETMINDLLELIPKNPGFD